MKAIELNYPLTIIEYFDISEDLLAHREYQETVQVCEKALQYYDKPGFRSDLSSINVSMGMAMKALGQSQESRKHFNKAIEQCRQNLEKDPNAVNSLSVIGTAFAGTGRYEQATEYFKRAIKIIPSKPLYRYMLIEALMAQKDYAGAQAEINDAIEYMNRAGNKEAVLGLQRLSDRVTYEGSQTGR
jgi:tetratricopeptide (TPR) repeat protein